VFLLGYGRSIFRATFIKLSADVNVFKSSNVLAIADNTLFTLRRNRDCNQRKKHAKKCPQHIIPVVRAGASSRLKTISQTRFLGPLV
jgi:hypothetical protein